MVEDGLGNINQPVHKMFKFDSGYVFLTYPHSAFEHGDLQQFINSVCTTEWLRIATENHLDGDTHLHVVGKFVRRFVSRNERVFDYQGRHPNIQSVRNVHKAIAYVAKDGQFTDYGELPAGGAKRSSEEALGLAGDPDEAKYLRACLEARVPFQYAKRFRELAFTDSTGTIDALYEALLSWECPRLQQETLPENSCAVVVGPSGCGKSSWAKRVAPKPALWVSHIDTLRGFRAGYHKSIIFDDMSFAHMPVQAQIHLVDWIDQRQIHCRYGCATIPAKTTKIFTCNEFPFAPHPAVMRRITSINVSGPSEV